MSLAGNMDVADGAEAQGLPPSVFPVNPSSIFHTMQTGGSLTASPPAGKNSTQASSFIMQRNNLPAAHPPHQNSVVSMALDTRSPLSSAQDGSSQNGQWISDLFITNDTSPSPNHGNLNSNDIGGMEEDIFGLDFSFLGTLMGKHKLPPELLPEAGSEVRLSPSFRQPTQESSSQIQQHQRADGTRSDATASSTPSNTVITTRVHQHTIHPLIQGVNITSTTASPTTAVAPPPFPSSNPSSRSSSPQNSTNVTRSPKEVVVHPRLPSSPEDLPPIHLSKSSTSLRFRCTTCRAPIGVHIFYGSPQELAEPLVSDIACIACSVRRDPGLLDQSPAFRPIQEQVSKKRRAQIAGKDRVVYCEACYGRIGFGGVRVGNGKGDGREREWVEPRASVEPVCDACVRNFNFCTQCGGGGKFRTGRWRPRQLFEASRKTCSLSHARMGAIENFQITSYRCPVEPVIDKQGNIVGPNFDPEPVVYRPDPLVQRYRETRPEAPGIEALKERRDEFEFLYRTRHLGAFATAAYMATHEFLSTWEKFLEFAELRHSQIHWLLLGGYLSLETAGGSPGLRNSLPENTRQFLCVVDGLRPKRTSRRKTASVKDTGGDDEELAGMSPRDPELLLVGYVFLEWFVPQRYVNAVHLLYVGKESVDDSTPERNPFKSMLAAGIDRVMKDVAAFRHPEPEHLISRVAKVDVAERTRYVVQLEKLGFFVLEEYCGMFGYDRERLAGMLESFILRKDEERQYAVLLLLCHFLLWRERNLSFVQTAFLSWKWSRPRYCHDLCRLSGANKQQVEQVPQG
ncbi:hypothetical protein HDU96_000386 [Phlyctochytrium bullatum]|nr:hypothetical protein HDU96_000386 [Phlyctochytrium bullatum]